MTFSESLSRGATTFPQARSVSYTVRVGPDGVVEADDIEMWLAPCVWQSLVRCLRVLQFDSGYSTCVRFGGFWHGYNWYMYLCPTTEAFGVRTCGLDIFSMSPCFMQTPVRCWVLRCSLLLTAVVFLPRCVLFCCCQAQDALHHGRHGPEGHSRGDIVAALVADCVSGMFWGSFAGWMHFDLCSSIVGRPTVCLHHGRYGPVRCFLLACLWYPWSRQ